MSHDLRSLLLYLVRRRVILAALAFVVCLPAAGFAATKFDFGGPLGISGPAADYLIYHPASTSFWYGLPVNGPVAPPLTPSFYHVLGSSASKIVPADYDGDGLTDYGVFDPSTTLWTIHYNAGGGLAPFAFGTNGVIPQSANFLGNVQAEIALFRKDNADWLIQTLPGSTSTPSPAFPPPAAYGQVGDKPVAEDYDADGYADVAIWRPSTGDWWIRLSTTGMDDILNWGIPGDIPAPADYNGDGKADRTLFRPSNGYWYIWESGSISNPRLELWGNSGDMPIPADYNGDGKADIAIYRPSDQTWWIKLSGWEVISGISVVGDEPVPHAYIQ